MPQTNARIVDLMRLLLWEGRLQNQRVRELFGLGTVRASQLIQKFRGAYPGLTTWDAKRKAFLATTKAYARGKARSVESALTDPELSLNSYLSLVGLRNEVESARRSRSDAVLTTAYRDLTTPRPELFAFLRTCCAEHTWATLTYRSMGSPAPHTRTVLPHSLVRAGRRWHVRAFTVETKSYRDYTLGRIERWAPAAVVTRELPPDVAWATEVAVRLVPHPDLTPAQEDVVRLEYMAGTASRVETCRGALVPFLLQDFRAATDTKAQRPPEFQLAVFNVHEVKPWLWA